MLMSRVPVGRSGNRRVSHRMTVRVHSSSPATSAALMDHASRVWWLPSIHGASAPPRARVASAGWALDVLTVSVHVLVDRKFGHGGRWYTLIQTSSSCIVFVAAPWGASAGAVLTHRSSVTQGPEAAAALPSLGLPPSQAGAHSRRITGEHETKTSYRDVPRPVARSPKRAHAVRSGDVLGGACARRTAAHKVGLVLCTPSSAATTWALARGTRGGAHHPARASSSSSSSSSFFGTAGASFPGPAGGVQVGRWEGGAKGRTRCGRRRTRRQGRTERGGGDPRGCGRWVRSRRPVGLGTLV
ncbi:hypothetical protein BD413DRAFT_276385 [Trametes elegans]|nr:hypothetical protein BD413DRAFT_276385 [Trametes elegans]